MYALARVYSKSGLKRLNMNFFRRVYISIEKLHQRGIEHRNILGIVNLNYSLGRKD